MIIHLSSTRPAKVEGARDAIAAIASIDSRFRHAKIQAHDLGGVGPAMPMSEAAIVDGARRRAEALLQQAANESHGGSTMLCFAVGLEGGVDPLPGVKDNGSPSYALKTWACVSDGRRWSYGAGGAVVLPHAVARQVLAGHELGDVIDALVGSDARGTRGAWEVLTKDLVGRRDAFRLAVMSAFAPFFNPEVYEQE